MVDQSPSETVPEDSIVDWVNSQVEDGFRSEHILEIEEEWRRRGEVYATLNNPKLCRSEVVSMLGYCFQNFVIAITTDAKLDTLENRRLLELIYDASPEEQKEILMFPLGTKSVVIDRFIGAYRESDQVYIPDEIFQFFFDACFSVDDMLGMAGEPITPSTLLGRVEGVLGYYDRTLSRTQQPFNQLGTVLGKSPQEIWERLALHGQDKSDISANYGDGFFEHQQEEFKQRLGASIAKSMVNIIEQQRHFLSTSESDRQPEKALDSFNIFKVQYQRAIGNLRQIGNLAGPDIMDYAKGYNGIVSESLRSLEDYACTIIDEMGQDQKIQNTSHIEVFRRELRQFMLEFQKVRQLDTVPDSDL